MGAKIAGLGTSRIVVEGVSSLHAAEHAVLPDRIETGTFAMAAAIAGGEVELTGTRAELIGAIIPLLESIGTEIAETNRGITVHRNGVRPIAVDVATAPFPGFPTDLQAQFMTLATQAEGASIVTENIFENRFMHAQELARMGANIRLDGKQAIIAGPRVLTGAGVIASDLRASASLVLAALVAKGETVIDRVYHIDRCYEKIEAKLARVGAKIRRVE